MIAWKEYDHGVCTAVYKDAFVYWTYWTDRVVVRAGPTSLQHCPQNWITA